MVARLSNRFELGERLEALEDGTWFRGHDVRGRRDVRIAILNADASDARRAAFDAASERALRVRHPSLERPVARGVDDEGCPYLIVEPGHGVSFGLRIASPPHLRLHDLLRAMTSVLNGLDAAHRAGLVHGGIEPSRVVVDELLRATLGGFALHAGSASARPDVAPYLAPEVRAGEEASAASDVYGIAALLYRAFIGEPPPLDGPVDLLAARDSLPASLVRAVEQALRSAPGDRQQSAGELRRSLTTAIIGATSLRSLLIVPGEPPPGLERPRAVEVPDEPVTQSLSLDDLEEDATIIEPLPPLPPAPPPAASSSVPPPPPPASRAPALLLEGIDDADALPPAVPALEEPPASPLEEAESDAPDEDEDHELLIGDDEDGFDEDDLEDIEGSWAEGPVVEAGWPYPTGGAPGLDALPAPSLRERLASPALAIALFALGALVAVVGLYRIVSYVGEGEAPNAAATVEAPPRPAPRRRPAPPAPPVVAAPEPAPEPVAEPELVPEPEPAPAPVATRPRRPRRPATTSAPAPTAMRATDRPALVRDPGF